MAMRIAFVVQRYGVEVLGGAESLAREVAEHLTPFIDVDVISTCAVDYRTWENVYPPGETILNGVCVHRFACDTPRSPDFDQHYTNVLTNPQASLLDEIDFMKAQGPNSSGLLRFLRDNHTRYALFIFVGYLYFQTYFGLQLAPQRSILLPTAHDELPLRLSLLNTVFSLPKGFIYLAPEEQQLIQKKFHVPDHVPQAVIGGGITLPTQPNIEAFRSKYNLSERYVLYTGRIDTSKKCDELFNWFQRFAAERPNDVILACTGKDEIPIPQTDKIRFLGMVPETDKFAAMAGAELFIMPSMFESFSIASLEAWACRTPLLANALGPVVRGHCVRSNGGLYYKGYDEFADCLSLLLNDGSLRTKLGRNGHAYVQDNYAWDVVTQRYLAFINNVLPYRWV